MSLRYPKPERREPKAPKPLQRFTRLRPVSTRRRAELPMRQETRRRVILRDRGRCRACGSQVGTYGHAHEIQFRSRGGDWLDLANVVLLCGSCHTDVHAHTLIASVVDPARGANGIIEFERADRGAITHGEA